MSHHEDTQVRGHALSKAIALFLVHSNLHMALAATGVAISATLLAGFSLEIVPLAIVFGATLFVYSANRFTDLQEDVYNVPRRVEFIRRYGRFWLGVSIGVYLVGVAVAVVRGVPGAVYLVLPLVVTLAYSLLRLKRVYVLKNALVGGSWGVIPLGVGVYYDALFHPEIVLFWAYVTIMVTVAAMVCDIQDITGDTEAGIVTVPIVRGPRFTRYIGTGVNILVALTLVAVVVASVGNFEFLVLLLVNVYVLGYTITATTTRGPLFYGLVIDSEHIVLAGILLTLEYFS